MHGGAERPRRSQIQERCSLPKVLCQRQFREAKGEGRTNDEVNICSSSEELDSWPSDQSTTPIESQRASQDRTGTERTQIQGARPSSSPSPPLTP